MTDFSFGLTHLGNLFIPLIIGIALCHSHISLQWWWWKNAWTTKFHKILSLRNTSCHYQQINLIISCCVSKVKISVLIWTPIYHKYHLHSSLCKTVPTCKTAMKNSILLYYFSFLRRSSQTHILPVLLEYWICQNAWQTNNTHYNGVYPTILLFIRLWYSQVGIHHAAPHLPQISYYSKLMQPI